MKPFLSALRAARFLSLFLVVASTNAEALDALTTGLAPPPTSVPGLKDFSLETITVSRLNGQSVSIVIPLGGQRRVVKLDAHSLRAEGFRLLVQGPDGAIRERPAPEPHTYRGHVEGLPGSVVTAALVDGRLSATVFVDSVPVWHVQPLSVFTKAESASDTHVVYSEDDLIPHAGRCGANEIHPTFPGESPIMVENGGMRSSGHMRVCEIAFDADTEFFEANGSSVANTVLDIETVMNGVAFIYEDQVNITYEITSIVVRTGVMDPYTATNHETLLVQFRNEWNSSLTWVQRDIAHLMTGKEIDGNVIGTAYNGVICEACIDANGYGLSQSRFTTVAPLRTCVTAHEIGHNWDAGHCDGDSDCAIMCGELNGCTGNCTKFGSGALASIVGTASTVSCLTTLADPLFPPFCDSFDGQVDGSTWSYRAGASLSTPPVTPPSPPFVLLLDDCCADCLSTPAPDEIRSNFIQLASSTSAVLSYHTAHDGEPWTAGSQLIVEYFNNADTWSPINRITSDGSSPSVFDFWIHPLPTNAFHDRFRIRFRLGGVSFQADWFIDDVVIANLRPEHPVLYVRQGAPVGGDGTNWDRAYKDLQEALAAAECSLGVVEEVWVSAGTYMPDRGTGSRSATFQLPDGVIVAGGFDGSEVRRDQRDPERNVTILSGEIGIPQDSSDNSYHVVTVSGAGPATVLDGFTITGGHANGAMPNNGGGGIWNVSGSPTISNCVVIHNRAEQGAGLLNFAGGSPLLRECVFIGNESAGSGGAIENTLGSVLTALNCRLLGNTAATVGGGVFNSNSSVMFTNCAFSGNSAGSGGAVYAVGSSSILTNCSMSLNTATDAGGGVFSSGSSTTLTNCIVWDNGDEGGTDESAQIHAPDTLPTVNYSLIQGWTGLLGGIGNDGRDPVFMDADGEDAQVGTADDDLRLTADSPAIDAGDPDFPLDPGATDLDGHPRLLCSQIDIGAYEFGIGDVDCDRAVDLIDFGYWLTCVTGPYNGPAGESCKPLDFDADDDVDLDDFRAFSTLIGNQ